MNATALDTNRVIDDALRAYNEALEIVTDSLRAGHGREAIATIEQMGDAFARMCGLARLSVTPYDHERDHILRLILGGVA